MPMNELQSDNLKMKKSWTSSSSPKRIKKRATRLQGGQVWVSQVRHSGIFFMRKDC